MKLKFKRLAPLQVASQLVVASVEVGTVEVAPAVIPGVIVERIAWLLVVGSNQYQTVTSNQ